MSAIVSYNGKRLIPAPFVNISVDYTRLDNDEKICAVYTLTLDGYILATKGSPQTTGVWGNFDSDVCESISNDMLTDAIIKKWCHITNCFKVDYYELVIKSSNFAASDIFKCYPKVVSTNLTTDDGNPQYAKYEIVLEANDIICDGVSINPDLVDSTCLRSYDESWDFSYVREDFLDDEANNFPTGDNRVFQVSHTISAQGAPEVTNAGVVRTGYEVAKDFVCGKITFGDISSSDVSENCIQQSGLDLTIQRNYVESHSFSETGATYSITESWIYSKDPYIHNYVVTHDSSNSDGCDTISINGNFTGYDIRKSGSIVNNAFSIAKSGYDEFYSDDKFKEIVEGITDITVSDDLESSSVGYNKFSGTVDYTHTYKQRPAKLVASAKYESVVPTYNWDEDLLYTLTFVEKGEINRKLNTCEGAYKLLSTSLDIDLVYPCIVPDPSGPGNLTMPIQGPRFETTLAAQIQSVVDQYHPNTIVDGSGNPRFTNIFVDSQNDNFDRNTGSYNYSVVWKYNYDNACNC